MRRGKKGAIDLEVLAWYIIGFAVLVFVVIGIVILSGKGQAALEYAKNLLRFRGG